MFQHRRSGLEGDAYHDRARRVTWPKRSVGRAIAKFAASGKVQAKKNLGLMQMQYKNVYVAYVSMGTNPAATVKTFNEAENYNGPYPPRHRRARRDGYVGCDHHRVRAHPLVRRYAVTFGQVHYELRSIGQDKVMEMLNGAPL